MPASAAQVFGPTTVDPGFTTTGEKTLLTMSTTLPAGGRNVIIVALGRSSTDVGSAQGTFLIYKGTTLLYESKLTEILNSVGMRAKHVLLVAIDSSPAGNDSYSFRMNITTASSTTTSVHVQGIVIKTDDAVWGYNTTAVSIEAGATATVTSISTTFPANSKVALVAVCYGSWAGSGHQLVGAGNVKLKADGSVVSSNQFNIGSYQATEPLWVSLAYLDTPASGSQTYSVEVTNGSSQTFNFYAEVVAFTVSDGAFLDTASVGLSTNNQVTVGNLTTSLSGDVAVIGLAASDYTRTTAVIGFNAGDVVLQLNNSTTGQIPNLTALYLDQAANGGRSCVLPLFRLDAGVANPSYQIKMTARASGLNGEAKILAFNLVVTVTVSDGGVGVDAVVVNASLSLGDSGAGVDVVDVAGSIPVGDSGAGVESVDMVKEALDSGAGVDYFTGGVYKAVDDYGMGMDSVPFMLKEAGDAGSGVDAVNMGREVKDLGTGVDVVVSPRLSAVADSGAGAEVSVVNIPVSDSGAGVDMLVPAREVRDYGYGVDIVNMFRNILDSGVGAEAVYVSASVFAYDYGSGVDAVGIVGYVSVEDYGASVDVVEWFLSMYGLVFIDMDDVGLHSIPYKDWRQKNIPVQVHRRSVGDRVYVDSDDVGDVVVEWEDKVSDVVPGERTLVVTGLVEIYD
jgi:hypothetical protein